MHSQMKRYNLPPNKRVADDSRSATTSRRRRDEWIDEGIIESLRRIAA
jgi:hypothetical protein